MKYIGLNLITVIMFALTNLQCFAFNTDSLEGAVLRAEPREQITIYKKLAIDYTEKDLPKAKFYIRRAVEAAKKINDDELLADSYYNFGWIYLSNQKNEESISYFQKALELYQLSDLTEPAGLCYFNMGLAYIRLGDIRKSLKVNYKALALIEEVNNQELLMKVYNNLATDYYHIEDYQKALEFYLKTKDIAEVMNDSLYTMIVLNNIGIIYNESSRSKHALPYFTKAIDMADALNYYERKGLYLLNRGIALNNIGEYLQAKEVFTETLGIFQDIKDYENISSVYLNLADMENYDKYQKDSLLNLSYYFAKKGNDSLQITLVEANLASNYYKKRNYQRAELLVHKTIDFYKSQKMYRKLVDNYELLKNIYAKQGKMDSVAKTASAISQYSDSLVSYYKKIFFQNTHAKNDAEYNYMIYKQKSEYQQKMINFQNIIIFGLIAFSVILLLLTILLLRYKKLIKKQNLELKDQCQKLLRINSVLKEDIRDLHFRIGLGIMSSDSKNDPDLVYSYNNLGYEINKLIKIDTGESQ